MPIFDWVLFLLLLKLVSYLAIVALAGNVLMRLLSYKSRASEERLADFFGYLAPWQITVVILGVIATLLQVPIEAAALAGIGFAGMKDSFMLEIVWQSVIGDQVRVRIPAFIVAIMALYAWKLSKKSKAVVNFLVTLTALVFIAYSFTFTGHNADKSILIKSLLTVHLIAIAAWLGSLWPLYESCKRFDVSAVKDLMHRFGRLAVVLVFVILISGLFLLLEQLNSFEALFGSSYGQLILGKLLFVCVMLLMGAWHKFYWVPNLSQQPHLDRLKLSISIEGLIAFLVLITTSLLTTLVGPPI